MEGYRFDAITRSLTGSRRVVLGSVMGSVLTWMSGDDTRATPKRRRKRRRRMPRLKPGKPNRFGCLSVNVPCRRHRQCCSGICRGHRGRRRCRRHGAGTCNQAAPAYCEASTPPLTNCDNTNGCWCLRTTGGSSYCGAAANSVCTVCERDADCVAQGFPPGSACAQFSKNSCAGQCATGTICVARCGSPPFPKM